MNDLTDLMREASDNDPNRALDPTELVQQGRRRLYRRRGIAAVSGVVAAALVIVAGGSWLSGTTDDSGPQPGDGRPPVAGHDSVDDSADNSASGHYDWRVHLRGGAEVSHAEAERRCTVIWHNLYGPTDLTVNLVGKPGPWFEGNQIEVGNWSKFPFGETMEHTRCLIPAAGLEDTVGAIQLPLPASDDSAGIREACGRFLGWDLSDWEVLVADSQDGRLGALLGTTGGDMATCQLDSEYLNARGFLDLRRFFADPHIFTTHDVQLVTAEELERAGSGWGDYNIAPLVDCKKGDGPGRWVSDCLVMGWVSGPEPAARIVITDVAGEEHEVPVNDRWFAFAGSVVNHAAVPEGGCPPEPNVCESPGELHFTVYAADGTVLAEYGENRGM